MSDDVAHRASRLDPEVLAAWRAALQQADRHNILCRCRRCGYEWIASQPEVCRLRCGSSDVEFVVCWQFPDD